MAYLHIFISVERLSIFKNYFIYFLNLVFTYLFPTGLYWCPENAGVPHFCWMEVGVRALQKASEDTTLPERTRLPCCCCRCILYLHRREVPYYYWVGMEAETLCLAPFHTTQKERWSGRRDISHYSMREYTSRLPTRLCWWVYAWEFRVFWGVWLE